MMNDFGRSMRACAALPGILGLFALGAAAEVPGPYESAPPKNETSAAVKTPETAVRDWPERSRSTALALISKYGEPSSFDDNTLTWIKNSPWRKTVVYRNAPQGFMHTKDILEQTIGYDVPEDKVATLKRFDERLDANKTAGELSSRSETESLNYLALNLADEIVGGKRSVDEARDFYHRMTQLSASGKSSAYMDGFVFPLKDSGAAPSAPAAPMTPAAPMPPIK
jgi:hypothetical protein